MNIVDYKISDLIPAEYNPRQLSKEQHEQIKASLQRFGFVDPVIVNTHEDRKNIIIGGHMRTRVAESLGFEEVPCVELCLNLDQEKELNIRLNKNTGEFDFDALSNYFEVDDLVDWGFSLDELDLLEDIEEVEPPDLGDGSDSVIQTMSLTLSNDQVELIKDAINKAKDELDCIDTINENSNGNAVHAICRRFLSE